MLTNKERILTIEIVRMTRTTETGRNFLIEGFGKEGLIRQPRVF
jgi:hypothetical protein